LLLILVFLHSNLTFVYRTSNYEILVDIFDDVFSLINSDTARTIFLVASVSRFFYDIRSYTA